jgi:DNA-binding transcriptional regulator LsrR (DeoR family)
MYYLDRMSQSEIAMIAGVSRSTVSRLLSAARDEGVVRISIDEFDPRDQHLEQELAARFGLDQVVVIRAADSTLAGARRAVGYFAAGIMAPVIASARTVGLAGGRTLAELVRHIVQSCRHQYPEYAGSGPTFVQLMGTISSRPSWIDASEQCRGLATHFSGDVHALTLPAYAQNRHVRDLFITHSDIRAVRERFADLDLALVGIGTLQNSAFIERGSLSPTDLVELRAAGAVGEVCGRFFDVNGDECDSSLKDRATSVELDVLRTLRNVVAVTSGAGRGLAMQAAIRSGIVTSVVIDQVGAQSMLDA